MTQAAHDPAKQRLLAFFRQNLMAEPGMPPELAERLAGRCVSAIDQTLSTYSARMDAPAQPTAPPTAPMAAPTVQAPPSPPSFDPFAFSIVAMLARLGREELISRLNSIPAIDNLRTLALAQHIYVDPTLMQPDDVRLAIVRGAEHRIASRRAAAS
jgi:hypothetical protein